MIIKKEDLQHIADPNEGYTIYPTFKYDSRKNFIGLYQYRAPKKLFHIKKMFLDPEAEKIEK